MNNKLESIFKRHGAIKFEKTKIQDLNDIIGIYRMH
jgi:hypothetical protein